MQQLGGQATAQTLEYGCRIIAFLQR